MPIEIRNGNQTFVTRIDVGKFYTGSLYNGTPLKLESTKYGFHIVNDPSMAGLSSGRFVSGDALQLVDGLVAVAVR